MTDTLKIFCLVEGDPTTKSFEVRMELDASVSGLAQHVMEMLDRKFNPLKPPTLWKVNLSEFKKGSSVIISTLTNKEELDDPTQLLSSLIQSPPVKDTFIVVQLPEQDVLYPPVVPSGSSPLSARLIEQSFSLSPKRHREEDEGSLSKRSRFNTSMLMEAISAAGLTDRAVVKGTPYLSRLNSSERVLILGFLGQLVDGDDDFTRLAQTAFNQRNTKADIKTLDRLSAPEKNLPVVNTGDLYIRKSYLELYNTILEGFKRGDDKRIVITGTAGIGKSVFLIYLAIRLLAESDNDNPPIVIYHTKDSKKCFVFGGCSIIRSGSIDEFESFLNVPETWYLVDSSLDPKVDNTYARTVISASPKTLFSDKQQYQTVVKTVEWHYYMAPWDKEELIKCRNCVKDFKIVPPNMVDELYLKIGGVPRYVLGTSKKSLDRGDTIAEAQKVSCERVEQALSDVQDALMLMQLFAEKKDSKDFSSRLVHRWPVGNHRAFRLEWASLYVADNISRLLSLSARTKVLKMLLQDPSGSSAGIMFESYVLRTFRDGGHTFELRDLETGVSSSLTIPLDPKAADFQTIPASAPGQLWIPSSCNFACVDMLFSPRDLLQITISKDHPIKGPQFQTLIRNLKRSQWIDKSDEARLIFVVPEHIFVDFKKQNYLASGGKVYENKNIPDDILNVKQFVMKINIKSAAAGKSPGLDGSGASAT